MAITFFRRLFAINNKLLPTTVCKSIKDFLRVHIRVFFIRLIATVLYKSTINSFICSRQAKTFIDFVFVLRVYRVERKSRALQDECEQLSPRCHHAVRSTEKENSVRFVQHRKKEENTSNLAFFCYFENVCG